MKYPRLLSSGANNKVIVLSETEVGKLFTGDTRSDIGSEAEKCNMPMASMSSSFALIASNLMKNYRRKCW